MICDGADTPLTAELSTDESVYVYMYVQGVDEYSEWASTGVGDSAISSTHPFEEGLLEMLNSVRSWTLMLAPSGDRLEEFISASPSELIEILGCHVKSLAASGGLPAQEP